MGRESKVADSPPAHPFEKSAVKFHRFKHTSLNFSVVTFYELRLDPNSAKFAVKDAFFRRA